MLGTWNNGAFCVVEDCRESTIGEEGMSRAARLARSTHLQPVRTVGMVLYGTIQYSTVGRSTRNNYYFADSEHYSMLLAPILNAVAIQTMKETVFMEGD